MVLFTGKTAPAGLHQYMPMKPIFHGFKLWARCGVSGYTYEIELYTGRKIQFQTSIPLDISFEQLTFDTSSISSASNSRIGESASTRPKRNVRSVFAYPIASASASLSLPPPRKVGLGGEVVLRLTERVAPNTRIFFDNFFASYALLKVLSDRTLWAVCTMRDRMTAKCPLPSKKQIEKQHRGSFYYRVHQLDEILICAWLDNKRVLLGSHYVGIKPIGTALRYERSQGGKVEIQRPNIVFVYNRHMGALILQICLFL